MFLNYKTYCFIDVKKTYNQSPMIKNNYLREYVVCIFNNFSSFYLNTMEANHWNIN